MFYTNFQTPPYQKPAFIPDLRVIGQWEKEGGTIWAGTVGDHPFFLPMAVIYSFSYEMSTSFQLH